MLKETYEAWAVEVIDHDGESHYRDFDDPTSTESEAKKCADFYRAVCNAKDARPVRVRVTVEAMEE